MPEPVRGDQKYLPGLDGLRALAVAAVVVYHLNFGWAQGGLLGVGVFFTLSGYLITDILLGQWDRAGRLRLGDFWLRRARRLLPALFVMLLVVAVWVNTLDRSELPGFRGDVIASALYVSNWWYIGQHASYYARFAPPAPLDHLWSLAVEEQFYLVWPWLVLFGLWLLARRRGRGAAGPPARTPAGAPAGAPARASAGAPARASAGAPARASAGAPARAPAGGGYLSARTRYWMAAAAIVVASASAVEMALLYQPGYDPTRVYEGTDTRAFGLLFGAALAMLWPTRRRTPLPAAARWPLDAAGAAGLAVIGLLVWRTDQYSPFMFRGGLVVLSLATVLVVAAVATPGSLLGRALGCGPLRWLGVRSYGIYLWHYPVIVLTVPALASGGGISVPRAVLTAATCVAIAAVSWKYVEEPVRRGFARSKQPQPDPARRVGRRRFVTPLTIGGLCLVAAGGIAAGVTAATSGPTTSANTAATTGAALGQPASSSAASASAHQGTRQGTHQGKRTPGQRPGHGVTGTPSAGSSADARSGASAGSASGTPRTSCRSVVHMGDSTSEGLISSDYLPNPADRIPARYADVGVTHSIMEIQGATSVVETINNQPNEYTIAKQLVAGGYRGCWVLALGVNDTADVYVGSAVGRIERIKKMMSVIGNQPVLWVEVKSLLSGGPYSEQNMMLWNQALQEELPHYPNMHLYNWPAVVQNSWFISDGIHYTSYGYLQRARLIADALATAFPAN